MEREIFDKGNFGGDRAPLEETDDTASIKVNVNVIKGRARGQAGHGLHVSDQGVQEPCSNRRADITDRQTKPGRHTLLGWVMRE